MIKTVITAAGKGTRLLPMTKEIPKEMMPIFSMYNRQKILMPFLQFIFEQLYQLKIRDYFFVVGQDKKAIKNHFTLDQNFLNNTSKNYRMMIKNYYKKIDKSNFSWINQNEPLGFGDAVRKTEKHVGKNDFIVHAGDAAVIGKVKHPVLRFLEIVNNDPEISAVLLFKKVKDARRYGVPEISKISDKLYHVHDLVEKPQKPKFNIGLLPIYYFKPKVFKYLKNLSQGKNNEIQLTDGIKKLIENNEKVVAIPLDKSEIELDIGTPESFRETHEILYKIS